MLRNMPLKYVSQWEEKSFGRPRSCRRRRPACVLHKMAAAINIRRPQKRLTRAITLFLLVCAIEKCRGDSIMVDDMKHFRASLLQDDEFWRGHKMMLGHQHLFPDEVKQTAATTGLVVASRPSHRRAATNSGEMITDHYVQLQGKIWMDLLEEKQIRVL